MAFHTFEDEPPPVLTEIRDFLNHPVGPLNLYVSSEELNFERGRLDVTGLRDITALPELLRNGFNSFDIYATHSPLNFEQRTYNQSTAIGEAFRQHLASPSRSCDMWCFLPTYTTAGPTQLPHYQLTVSSCLATCNAEFQWLGIHPRKGDLQTQLDAKCEELGLDPSKLLVLRYLRFKSKLLGAIINWVQEDAQSEAKSETGPEDLETRYAQAVNARCVALFGMDAGEFNKRNDAIHHNLHQGLIGTFVGTANRMGLQVLFEIDKITNPNIPLRPEGLNPRPEEIRRSKWGRSTISRVLLSRPR